MGRHPIDVGLQVLGTQRTLIGSIGEQHRKQHGVLLEPFNPAR
jgi:hypothetical protein